MSDETLRNRSREGWISNTAGGPTIAELKLGCLQRIADATEATAKEYNRLLSEARYLRERRDELQVRAERLARSNSALRGTIKRMKNKAAIA